MEIKKKSGGERQIKKWRDKESERSASRDRKVIAGRKEKLIEKRRKSEKQTQGEREK